MFMLVEVFFVGSEQEKFMSQTLKNDRFTESRSGGRLLTPEILVIWEKIKTRKCVPLAAFHTIELSENLKNRGFTSTL